jgi:tRNA dimethylallyltransferase
VLHPAVRVSDDAVLIVAGATCSGKTALAVDLAEQYDAEIIGADSRQVYRGMPIGTAAPAAEQLARVPHHLVAMLDPHERYSAARFSDDALAAIRAIRGRGKRALVVGGTGFYLRALAGDVVLSPAYDAEVRARLAREARLHPPEVMHAWLAARDPGRAAELAVGDRYRVTRALEIALSAGSPDEPAQERQTLRSQGYRVVKIVLDVPQAVIDERIAARVEGMLEAGLLAEAERIGPDAVAADAVGYPQALAYLAGLSTDAELRTTLARATRRYALRQRTWFRTEPGTQVVAPADVAQAVRSELGWT